MIFDLNALMMVDSCALGLKDFKPQIVGAFESDIVVLLLESSTKQGFVAGTDPASWSVFEQAGCCELLGEYKWKSFLWH